MENLKNPEGCRLTECELGWVNGNAALKPLPVSANKLCCYRDFAESQGGLRK